MVEKSETGEPVLRTFRLLRGVHYSEGEHEVAKKYVRGDMVKSSQDLVKMFGKTKFQEYFPGQAITSLAPEVAPNIDPLQLDPVDNPTLDQTDKPEKPSLGQDVTESFALANQKHVRVFYDGNKYSVTDPTDLTTAMNDEETLADEKAVAKFLKKLPE